MARGFAFADQMAQLDWLEESLTASGQEEVNPDWQVLSPEGLLHIKLIFRYSN